MNREDISAINVTPDMHELHRSSLLAHSIRLVVEMIAVRLAAGCHLKRYFIRPIDRGRLRTCWSGYQLGGSILWSRSFLCIESPAPNKPVGGLFKIDQFQNFALSQSSVIQVNLIDQTVEVPASVTMLLASNVYMSIVVGDSCPGREYRDRKST